MEQSVENSPIATPEPPVVLNQEQINAAEDQTLGDIWSKLQETNGAERGDDGKFKSAVEEDAPANEPLEGGGGEEAEPVVEPSTPAASEVPLPSNWRGLEKTWEKIPVEVRGEVKVHMDKLQQQASDLGREVAAVKPVAQVLDNYKEYFDGTAGNYKKEDAVNFLFSLQRSMDAKPVETLLEIADRYNLRPQLAEMFGAGSAAVNPDTAVLLSEIAQLKTHLAKISDTPDIGALVETKLSEKKAAEQVNEVISRTSKEMPLYSEIDEADLVYHINKSWEKLGPSATQEAVLKRAYDMAVNADPDLRSKAAALKPAAATNTDPARLAAAKNANQSNLRSTSSGNTRKLTTDEELGAVWDKANSRG